MSMANIMKIKRKSKVKQSVLRSKNNIAVETNNASSVVAIPCDVKEIPEFSHSYYFEKNKLRKGRYVNCIFTIPNFGVNKWVFGCYIKPKEKIENLTDKEIVKGCIQFLNQAPERKKFSKKNSKPIFGNLDLDPIEFSQKKINNEIYFIVLVLTDERTNDNLWGEGVVLNEKRR
jgi:hypothetical protein